MIGTGVLITRLFGSQESHELLVKGLNQEIASLVLNPDDEALHIGFTNGYRLRIFDDGQSCCESRYMRTDDRLEDFLGATLLSAEIADGPDGQDCNDDVHEIQFLRIGTSKGTLVFSNHNEHNGYYGGFAVVVKED